MTATRIASCRLYGFIDTAYLAGRQPGAVTQELIAGGVDVIQVRAKEMSHAQRVELARAVVKAAQDVPVIVNDDIAAARETGAAGVHLGQEDYAAVTRDQLTGLSIIGISTHTLAQARQAAVRITSASARFSPPAPSRAYRRSAWNWCGNMPRKSEFHSLPSAALQCKHWTRFSRPVRRGLQLSRQF